MADTSVTIRPASETDREDIVELLSANDLPSQDVLANTGDFFVACDGATVVGCGGVEIDGTDGLLRSIAVRESDRGRGYGVAICETVEAHARASGVDTLYVLTTTAATFFRHRGYETTDRESVPPRIRQTTEFDDLCPASATCLSTELD